MLPPIDDTLLKDNPNFALLYGKLTNTILNPDASTKDDDTPAAKQRDAIRKELDQHRLTAVKHHLLTQAIATATPPESKPASRSIKLQPQQPKPRQQPSGHQDNQSSLPDPLIDLLLILPPLLDQSSPPLPSSQLNLLLSSPPFTDLDALLPSLANLLSSNLHTSALSLTRIAHPSTNPSYLHRQIPSLPSTILQTTTSHLTLQRSLSQARLSTLSTLLSLLTSQSQTLTALIRLLELKHGIISRSLELRATDAALLSQQTEVDAEQALWTVRRDVYDKQAVEALRNYAAHLRDARVRAEERLRGLRTELAEYGVGVEGAEGKEKMMREMARVWRDMGRQMKDTKGDLDRLQRG